MPDTEVVRKWVDALRSGKYAQATGELRNDDGFCCLGVLCELAAQEGVIKPAVRHDTFSSYYYDGAYTLPPAEVARWVGLDSWMVTRPEGEKYGLSEDDGYCTNGANCSCKDPIGEIGLPSLNDGAHYSFAQIADVIEKEWLDA